AYGKSGVSYALELSVNGSEWTPYEGDIAASPAPTENGDFSVVLAGEELNEYAYIRARLRYTADEIPLQSEYSDAIAFDIRPAETVTAPISENTLPLYTEDTAGEGELKYICPICGICPAPYGVCLFLWIGAALLIVLLIVLIIALIPKKKYCPRCSAVCRPDEKTCTTCGYRFVGSMPEIEDTTDEIPTPGKPVSTEDEDAFFAAGMASDSVKPAEKPKEAPAPTPAPMPEAPAPEAQKTAAAAPVSAPVPSAPAAAKPDAAFLAELKRKMAAVKAGQKQTFTPEEIAYIKALKERAAAPKPAPAPVPAPAEADNDNTATKELPPVVHTVRPETDTAAEKPAEKPAAEAAESREEQIARLRALRAKQLAAEKDTAPAAPAQKPAEQKPAEALRRVEKPAKQIKCPACAVPNPETNGQCYICGTRLK
ncbi:MAG: hypothetical protein IJ302_01050, partial [Clostridia bacterium]|nr:hypothetical protein [Clostridia bacterium]